MADLVLATPEEVLAFWFGLDPKQWYEKDDAFDAEIRRRFLPTYEAAAAGGLTAWEAEPRSALALVIVLDQFPRNMFRASTRSFAADPLALAIAKRAIDRGFDQQLSLQERNFLYLPFQHSEDLADQERCVQLVRQRSDADTLKWAVLHHDIILRFGRFPHRNAILGRATTPEERAFLDAGGFAG